MIDPIHNRESSPPAGLTPGRVVHYVLPHGWRYAGEHRPAMVVKVWGSPPSEPFPVQLAVFLDGTNDMPDGDHNNPPMVKWATSVTYDPEGQRPGSWHWPERA